MSNAKPMLWPRRTRLYARQTGRREGDLTPRQRRRHGHKLRRAKGYVGRKGRPTPRRADARAAMLERRRG